MSVGSRRQMLENKMFVEKQNLCWITKILTLTEKDVTIIFVARNMGA
jgi:hypothetical protein